VYGSAPCLLAFFACLLISKIASAADNLHKGVIVSGIERRMEIIVSPRGPDHHSIHFWRRDVQSAINEAVCCCVGMSPVKSSQNTASTIGESPWRGNRAITSGIVSPRYMIYKDLWEKRDTHSISYDKSRIILSDYTLMLRYRKKQNSFIFNKAIKKKKVRCEWNQMGMLQEIEIIHIPPV